MEKTKKIYFRADGNSRIGYGHVIRSLAVADMLANDFKCIFIVQTPNEWLLNQINGICAGCIELPIPENSESEAEFIGSSILREEDILILDGYHFTTEYQRLINKNDGRVVCIDDLHSYHFLADLVINHAGGVKEEDYSTEAFTKISLGPDYAMLRKAFLDAINTKRIFFSVEAVFICFGGADIHQIALKIARICSKIEWIRQIHIVSADPVFGEFQQKHTSGGKEMHVYENLCAEEMVAVLGKCQIAICPSSSLAYEACTVGIGLITGIHAENQQTISYFLQNSGCAKNIGDFRVSDEKLIRGKIEEISIQTINEQIRNQRIVFKDSRSAFKGLFAKLAIESDITVRRASENDLKTYFDWAMDPMVRQNSIQTSSFTMEMHEVWYHDKIASRTSILYFFEYMGKPLAQVRFELDKNVYLINYSVDKNFRGKGLADIVVKMAIKTLTKEIKSRPSIKALVKQGNIASSKTFKNNSFFLQGFENINDVSYEVYNK